MPRDHQVLVGRDDPGRHGGAGARDPWTPLALAFSSKVMPSQCAARQALARISGACSPIPAVNTAHRARPAQRQAIRARDRCDRRRGRRPLLRWAHCSPARFACRSKCPSRRGAPNAGRSAARSLWRPSDDARVERAGARPHRQAIDCGETHCGGDAFPRSMAHMLAPLPRWATTSFPRSQVRSHPLSSHPYVVKLTANRL